ncbi:hypothetical protein HPB48_026313 [Haemaphysalis longicornis]|uniref:CCHC-type domain-containing protein n=1 Tax=Haemaphysalis longicornis TaxID=44386 RepID=A0A9J6HBQ5_HAELO|nr:hypothetical protein HPB48_026313 [Haemaphysalis longicornis]
MRSSRQPLLPRDEHKVIIRPRNGLQLNAIGTVALARALSKTVQAPKEISSAWTVIIEPNQNIGIVSTPHAQAALYLKNLRAVDINGQMCEVTAYLAAPDNSIKGVIHQIPQGTTEEELRDQIRADGYNVIQARMLGRSTSAVITFEGKTLPHHICYWGAYVRCYPYRRSTLVCHVCRKMGHRADVCPNSSEGACGDCGEKHNPQQLCTPKCAICQGEHSTGSKACNQRYRPPVKPKQTTDDKTSTTGARKTGLETETGQRHRSRSKTRNPANPSSTTAPPGMAQDGDNGRRAGSRPRSPSGTRHGPKADQGQRSSSVSWADRLISTAPKNDANKNDPTLSQILAEIKQLKSELQQTKDFNKQLLKENEQLRAQLMAKPNHHQPQPITPTLPPSSQQNQSMEIPLVAQLHTPAVPTSPTQTPHMEIHSIPNLKPQLFLTLSLWHRVSTSSESKSNSCSSCINASWTN